MTWGATRTKNWPDVPTLQRARHQAGGELAVRYRRPQGVDRHAIKVLHDAFAKGVQEPSYAEALKKFDQELAYLNTADYEKHAVTQIEDAKKLIEELGLKTN